MKLRYKRMACEDKNKYKGSDGTCCERCPAGKYVKAKCNATQATQCEECPRGYFTATTNHLNECKRCKDCISRNQLKKVQDCTSVTDTVCECSEGYFCSSDECEHCQSATFCKPGFGVKQKAVHTNDTICAKCEEGTYSNVTDFSSACVAHTRCEDFGGVVATPGTSTADAICRPIKCSWMLPAGLWSGLVLSILIVAVFILWRAKRRSHRCTIPVTLKDDAPPLPVTPPEPSSHCQESGNGDECKLPLFITDDALIILSMKDRLDHNPPITERTASVSFTESSLIKDSTGHNTGNFVRLCSEPQEDEWSGTY
ncbi:tumor necrosis factor receptor superfamily member 5 isoform 2-T2 [Menidia menidia]